MDFSQFSNSLQSVCQLINTFLMYAKKTNSIRDHFHWHTKKSFRIKKISPPFFLNTIDCKRLQQWWGGREPSLSRCVSA